MPAPRTRLPLLLWIAAFVLFIAIWLYPDSYRFTRAFGLALFVFVWFGLIALCWRRRAFRFFLLGITALCAIFLLLPARKLPDADSLRNDYLAALRRYDGVTYVWGGESPKGIDCSGLIRRGLIDAMFLRGLRTFDPGLVRRSFALWWRDCTARALGEAQDGATVPLLDTPSINELDHTAVLPGDLAVTRNGVHIMAYLGNRTWIEADPEIGKVITVPVPSENNIWFKGPMKIVRWSILAN